MRPDALLEGVDHPLQAANRREEHRSVGIRGGPAAHQTHGFDEARMKCSGGANLGNAGECAEAVAVAGVDAAEQWVDQILEHLIAQPTADECTDRFVARRPVVGRVQILGCPSDTGVADQTGLGQRVQLGRDAEEIRGQWMEPATPSDAGLSGGRSDQLIAESQLLGQVDHLGLASEEGIGGRRQFEAGERGRGDLAAQHRRRLEQRDVGSGVDQRVRCSQAGNAAADDGDPTLSHDGRARAPRLVRARSDRCRA